MRINFFTFLISVLLLASARAENMQVGEAEFGTISLHGRVTKAADICGRLKKLIAWHKTNNAFLHTVYLSSPGGDAQTGYCVGEVIREAGLTTVATTGGCESSCSRMWLGGVHREIHGFEAFVGLHGNYDKNGDLIPTAPARLKAWIPKYAPQVDRRLMDQWVVLPHNYMMMRFYFDHAELCNYHQHRCTPIQSDARSAGLMTN
jgi:hypothetical protein